MEKIKMSEESLAQMIVDKNPSEKQLIIAEHIQKYIEETLDEIGYPIRDYTVEIDPEEKVTIYKTKMTLTLREKKENSKKKKKK